MEQLIVFFVKDLNFYSDYKIKMTIQCSEREMLNRLEHMQSYPVAAWVDGSCRQIVAPFTNKNGFSANSKINTNNFTLEQTSLQFMSYLTNLVIPNYTQLS